MKKLRDYIAESEKQLAEKAVSKQQQKFMGMVHAAQQGEKPASPEVAKVAKSMGKKDVTDFAKTKHAGLPEKIDEISLGDYSRKAGKSKALAQMSQAFSPPEKRGEFEKVIQKRTAGLERASDRAKKSLATAQAARQEKYQADELANKDKLESQLKDLESRFDPMFDRSDDHSYWTKQKGIRDQINDLKRRLAKLNKPTNESIMESSETLSHILNRFKHEVGVFKETGTLDDDLYDDLYDYYSNNGEMPYGIAKARSGDPYTWVADKFDEFLQSQELGEEVDPMTIPAYKRKGNSRLGGIVQPATQEPKRLVHPENIPAVQRKAANKDFPVADTSGSDSSIDIIRKMAGLPPRK